MTNSSYTKERHRKCSIKKPVLKNFAVFTGKHLCWSLFLINVAGLRLVTYLKRLQHRCFPVNIAKFLRTPILKKICQPWLLYMKDTIMNVFLGSI